MRHRCSTASCALLASCGGGCCIAPCRLALLHCRAVFCAMRAAVGSACCPRCRPEGLRSDDQVQELRVNVVPRRNLRHQRVQALRARCARVALLAGPAAVALVPLHSARAATSRSLHLTDCSGTVP